jgi:ABC-2 type transport system ATP-binding protein
VVDGDPVLATRTLRNDFETARQAEHEAAQSKAPPPPATVTGVRLLMADGSPVTEIAPGDDLRIEVDVDAASPLENWVLGIGIDNASGQNVYGTNTQMLGTKLPTLTGRGTYELRLRNISPGPGDYTVHSAVAIWSGPQIHHLPQAATFTVRSDGRSIGSLGAQPVLVTT